MASPHPFAYLVGLRAGAPVLEERLAVLAKVAAKRYIDDTVPLNESIGTLARERDLNPHQVERVCEMANLATHQALWGQAKEKEKIAFVVADAKAVVAAASSPPRPSLCARIDLDYAAPPPAKLASAPPPPAWLSAPPAPREGARGEPTPRQRLLLALEKKAHARRQLVDRILFEGIRAEEVEANAFRAVKQAVLAGTPMTALARAAQAAGLANIGAELLPRFEQRLVAQSSGALRSQLDKTAIARAPEELISPNLHGTTVVNGAHPVLVTLDLVRRQNDLVDTLLHGLVRIDDEIQVYEQTLRELG